MKPEHISDLVRYRMQQAQIALQDAQYLQAGNRSPQSIVNRSYYAMFYAVLALLQTTGKIPSKHTGAIGLFDREFIKKGIFNKEASRSLHKAFYLRQEGDYQILKDISLAQAAEVLENAIQFV